MLLSITSTLLFYSYYKVYDMNILNADVTVKETKVVGFNTDTDAVHFGIIPPSGSGARNISLTNIWDKKVLISITSHGEIKNWVNPKRNNFILNPDENTEVQLTIKIPENASMDNYTGLVKVFFLRP